MFQTKDDDRALEKELNKVETGNLPAKEFAVIAIRMFTGLARRVEELRENKETKYKSEWTKNNNNMIEESGSRLEDAKEQISNPGHRVVESTQGE